MARGGRSGGPPITLPRARGEVSQIMRGLLNARGTVDQEWGGKTLAAP